MLLKQMHKKLRRYVQLSCLLGNILPLKPVNEHYPKTWKKKDVSLDPRTIDNEEVIVLTVPLNKANEKQQQVQR